MIRHLFLLTVVIGSADLTGTATAQVQLDRLYPPAVSVGAESSVQAEGKFPTWPAMVVCDRDDVEVKAAKDSGQLTVSVAKGAATGIAWIRLHDDKSASAPVPLLIASHEVASEKEPNNRISEAGPVPLPCVVSGRLQKSGDVDTFRVPVQAGQTLIISAAAHRPLRSPMDMVLQLIDARGNVIRQSDDVRGLDPQIVYRSEEDEDCLVRLFAFPETPNSTIGFAGASSFVYALSVTTTAFADHFLPLTCGDAAPTEFRPSGWNLPPTVTPTRHDATTLSPPIVSLPETIGWQWIPTRPGPLECLFDDRTDSQPPVVETLPCAFSGHIDHAGEIDRIRMRVSKGHRYRATVHSVAYGFHVDSVLRLVNAENGNELASNDDRGRRDYDAVLNYTAKTDGIAELQVSDLLDGFGPRHAYSVVIERPEPSVELTIAADRYSVKAGETVELPITISRQDGFADKLKVTALGLPSGVTVAPVMSEPKGDTSKAIKLKLSADKSITHQGPFQIIGQRLDDKDAPVGTALNATYRLRDQVVIKTIWLTVAPAG